MTPESILMKRSCCIAALAAMTIISQPSFAHASASPDEPEALSEAGGSAGDIVVTAQRRAERPQDVPITLTTISSERLATADVRSLSDIPKLTPGLRFDLGASYTNAELTQNVPQLTPIPAFDGDRLPGSPRFSANFSAQYEMTIAGHEAFVRADSMYAGEFFGDLQQSSNLRAGGYAKVDVRAGVSFDGVDIELFVRNLTDEDAFTWRTMLAGTVAAYQLRPRTVGVQLGYRFE